MKKLISALACVFIFISVPLFAADISIGATTWCSWWDLDQQGSSQTSDPTFLYGPVLAVGFARNWSVTAVLLYGEFDFSKDDGPGTIERIDSDLSLNYNINRYLKVFGGAKYMGYTFGDGHHRSAGPALGIGATLPLGYNFFILANVSGVYNFGWEKSDGDSNNTRMTNFTEPGVNTTLNLAYYVEPASVTITLGGRYQYFTSQYDSDRAQNIYHNFYGITLSAVYSFPL